MRTMRRVKLIGLAGLLSAGGTLTAVAASAPRVSATPMNYRHLNKIQQRLVSGLLAEELGPQTATPGASRSASIPTVYQPKSNGECRQTRGLDVQVNQNCLNISDPTLQGRAQAQNETWMASDPNAPSHLIATYNDYRRGDGTCGTSYSLDGGTTWRDSTTPNGFTLNADFGTAREYWQAGGDTSVAYDSHGNAYMSCQLFNRGQPASTNPDQSSGFFVYRSTGNAGASWNFPGRVVDENASTTGTNGVLIDKALLAVDSSKTSRYTDRVYVTWTTFAADGTGYIYESYSSDYGESFSAPVLVSSNSKLCANTFGLPTPNGTCNENQFSEPFTAPDGTLYVVYANFNNNTAEPTPPGGDAKVVNPNDNFNQMLISRSTDGGRSFSSPVQAGRYYDLPDCATYQNGQDPGRACVPEKGASFNSVFRATNYPMGAVDPVSPGNVVVTYGSYINRDSQEASGCAPAGFSLTGSNLYTGVKPGGCNNDIVLSTSTNGGRSFSGTGADPRIMPVVTTGPRQSSTDQFWQGESFTPTGTLAVGYYDRSYGTDETTGYSDVSLSTSTDLVGFTSHRVTGSSMPPPTEFSGLFYGDYIDTAAAGSTVYPIWSDTRNPDLFLCPGTGTVGHPPLTCAASAPNAPLANDQEISTRAMGT